MGLYACLHIHNVLYDAIKYNKNKQTHKQNKRTNTLTTTIYKRQHNPRKHKQTHQHMTRICIDMGYVALQGHEVGLWRVLYYILLYYTTFNDAILYYVMCLECINYTHIKQHM